MLNVGLACLPALDISALGEGMAGKLGEEQLQRSFKSVLVFCLVIADLCDDGVLEVGMERDGVVVVVLDKRPGAQFPVGGFLSMASGMESLSKKARMSNSRSAETWRPEKDILMMSSIDRL